MTEREYREHPAISRSQLFKLRESPEKFKWAMDHPEQPTPALVFGQLLHAMVLQPDTVDEQFAVTTFGRKTKTFDKQQSELAEAVTLVTKSEFEQAVAMKEKLESIDYVRQLLSGEREKPFFWKDDLTGEECKCRVDCLTSINGMNIIVDLKTAESADTDIFMRHAIKYGYNLQAAMYGEGVKANTGKEYAFVFVVIEKKPPYAINIMQADKAFVLHGFDLFRELIGTYHECKTTGNWYGYLGKHNIINNLPLPAYLAKEIE